MPLDNASALLQKTAEQTFWNRYYGIPDPFMGLTERRTSTQKTDTFARLGAAPMPTEWVGDKQAKPPTEFSYTGTNVPYEASTTISKEMQQFQQWDEIGSHIGNLGQKANALRPSLLSDTIMAGDSTAGDDGQFFFDTDHADPGAEYSTSQDNDRTTNITTANDPTDLEFAAAIRDACNQFWSFKDDRGDPMVPSSDDASNYVVMVPPNMRAVARRVLIASDLTGPVSNDLQGTYTLRTNPFISAEDTKFYVFLQNEVHKPFIENVVQDVRMDDTMGGDHEWASGDVDYSATWWGAYIYGDWRTAILHTFT